MPLDGARLTTLRTDVKALLEDVASIDGEYASRCDYIAGRMDDLGPLSDVTTPEAAKPIWMALEVTLDLLDALVEERGMPYAERADDLYEQVDTTLIELYTFDKPASRRTT